MRTTLWIALTLTAGLALTPACAPVQEDGDASDGDGPDGDGPDGDGPGTGEYRLVELVATADGVDRAGVDVVTGIRCAAADHCAFATRNRDSGGALFTTADGDRLEPVFTSKDIEAATGLIGYAQFLSIDDTGAGWIARLDIAEPFVMSSGDPASPASWSMVDVGSNESDSDFSVLNNQELVRASAAGDWLYIYSGVIWRAGSAPGSATTWSGMWAPHRVPTFPRDYEAQKDADPTLCDSDPVVAVDPDMGQLGYASDDLGFVVYPAGGRNQAATDPPGVCVSHDGGASFHQVPFPNLAEEEIGPLAVHCLDADRCWAFNGVAFDGGPAYVYYSSDASAANPTWRRGVAPSEDDDDQPRALAMAPDGQRGWLVGDDGLAWQTSDGGATWTDARAELAGAAGGDVDWTSVVALEGGRAWFGGAAGVLLKRD
jgi:hypothetical protein